MLNSRIIYFYFILLMNYMPYIDVMNSLVKLFNDIMRIAYPYFILEWNIMLNSRIVIMGDYIYHDFKKMININATIIYLLLLIYFVIVINYMVLLLQVFNIRVLNLQHSNKSRLSLVGPTFMRNRKLKRKSMM